MFQISRLSSELVAGDRLEALVAPYLKTAAVVTIGVVAGPELAAMAGVTVVILDTAADAASGGTPRVNVPVNPRSAAPRGTSRFRETLRAVVMALMDHRRAQSAAAGPTPTDGCGCDQHQLSKREIEVLTQLQNGVSNKQIARNLQIAEATVKIHVRHILVKTSCENRTQAAIWARSNPLLLAGLERS